MIMIIIIMIIIKLIIEIWKLKVTCRKCQSLFSEKNKIKKKEKKKKKKKKNEMSEIIY